MKILDIHEKVWIAVTVLASHHDGIIVRVNDAYTNLESIASEQLQTKEQQDLLTAIHTNVAAFRKLANDPKKAVLSNRYEVIARDICKLYAEIIHQRLNPQP